MVAFASTVPVIVGSVRASSNDPPSRRSVGWYMITLGNESVSAGRTSHGTSSDICVRASFALPPNTIEHCPISLTANKSRTGLLSMFGQ